MVLKYNIQYGWCYTDHKDGIEIRDGYDRDDYMFDSMYHSYVKSVFNKFCLPFPEKEQVFRGTAHDMLFLDSHGLVIRVGPTDAEDLMNPAILQPIGWEYEPQYMVGNMRSGYTLNNRKYPLGVSIYPGIEIMSKLFVNKQKTDSMQRQVATIMEDTGQRNREVNSNNSGIIRIYSEDGREDFVPLLLDIDNNYNGTRDVDFMMRRSKLLQSNLSQTDNMASAWLATMEEVYSPFVKDNSFFRAQEVHQPLRHSFWEACKNSDKQSFESLWDNCAELTTGQKELTFPVWKKEDRAYIRSELKSVKTALYNPWVSKFNHTPVNLIQF